MTPSSCMGRRVLPTLVSGLMVLSTVIPGQALALALPGGEGTPPLKAPPVKAPAVSVPAVSVPVKAPPVPVPVKVPPVSVPVKAPPVSVPVKPPPVSVPVKAPPVSVPVKAPPVKVPVKAPPVSVPVKKAPAGGPVKVPSVNVRTPLGPSVGVKAPGGSSSVAGAAPAGGISQGKAQGKGFPVKRPGAHLGNGAPAGGAGATGSATPAGSPGNSASGGEAARGSSAAYPLSGYEPLSAYGPPPEVPAALGSPHGPRSALDRERAVKRFVRELHGCLSILPERLRSVLELRTGIGVAHELTPNALAGYLHVAFKQVLKLEARALRRLHQISETNACGRIPARDSRRVRDTRGAGGRPRGPALGSFPRCGRRPLLQGARPHRTARSACIARRIVAWSARSAPARSWRAVAVDPRGTGGAARLLARDR